jgi:hypothetical protein
MAFIVFQDNTAVTLPHAKAVAVDKVKKGQMRGTPAQLAFAKRVKKIYFGKEYQEQREQKEPWYQK